MKTKNIPEVEAKKDSGQAKITALTEGEEVKTTADMTEAVLSKIKATLQSEGEKEFADALERQEAPRDVLQELAMEKAKREEEHKKMLEDLRLKYKDIIELLSNDNWLDLSSFNLDISTDKYYGQMDISDLRREFQRIMIDKSLVLSRYRIIKFEDPEFGGHIQHVKKIEFKFMDPDKLKKLKELLDLDDRILKELGIPMTLDINSKSRESEEYHFTVTSEIPKDETEKNFEYIEIADNKLA